MKYTPEDIKKVRDSAHAYGEQAEDLINELLDEIEQLQYLITSSIRVNPRDRRILNEKFINGKNENIR